MEHTVQFKMFRFLDFVLKKHDNKWVLDFGLGGNQR